MWLHAEKVEAFLRSEQDAFEEVRECLADDLNLVHISLEETKTREHEAVAECQHARNVFKFKKYKEGYEDGKPEVSPRYQLDIRSFFRDEGRDPPESSSCYRGGDFSEFSV